MFPSKFHFSKIISLLILLMPFPANSQSDRFQKVDIGKYPKYFFKKDFNPQNITLFGIGFGDDENKIDPKGIKGGKNSAGWIHMKNGVGYRIENGKVAEFVFHKEMIQKLGINKEEEILSKFGKPDLIQQTPDQLFIRSYHYWMKGLIIRIGKGGGIDLINIAKDKREESVETYDTKPFDLPIEKLPINYKGHSLQIIRNLYPPEKTEFETMSSYMKKVEEVNTDSLYAFKISAEKSYVAEEEKMYVEVTKNSITLIALELYNKNFPTTILPMVEGSRGRKEIDENYRYYVPSTEIANVVKDKYMAENVAGVKREVERTIMDSYELQICNFKWIPSLPPRNKYRDYLTFSINMDGETAKFNKDNLSILFISRLVNTVPIFKTKVYGKPTIDRPWEMLSTSFHIPIKVERIWIYNTQTGRIFSKLPMKSGEK